MSLEQESTLTLLLTLDNCSDEGIPSSVFLNLLNTIVLEWKYPIEDIDVMGFSRFLLTCDPKKADELMPFFHDFVITGLPLSEAIQASRALESRASKGSLVKNIASEDYSLAVLEVIGVSENIFESNMKLFFGKPLPWEELLKYKRRKKISPAEISDIAVAVVDLDEQRALRAANLLNNVIDNMFDPVAAIQVYFVVESGFEKFNDFSTPDSVQTVLGKMYDRMMNKIAPLDNKFELYLADIPKIP